MTTPRVAYTLALVEAVKARIEGMKIENETRLERGEAPAYGEAQFFAEAGILQRLAVRVIQGQPMELTTVNKLYLELGQFATVKTEADINLEYAQKVNNRRFRLLSDILECDEDEHLPAELKNRIKEEVLTLPSLPPHVKQDKE